MKYRWVFLLASGVALLGQSLPQARELERLGEGGREVLVLGLEAQGFDKLRPHQRKFAYYLYRAAIAGNDIAYLQNHRFALDIKELFEVLYTHREGMDAETTAGIEDYLKQVWVNHGQYRHWDHAKFVPAKLSFAQLQKAVKTAKQNKAQFHFAKGETVERALVRLKPHIFDPKVEPVLVNQTAGQDPIATSASGLYDRGLSLKDIQALPQGDQTRLNVRFARKGKRAVAEPFMIHGVYGEQLSQVAFWLRKAAQYVDNEMVEREIEKGGVKAKKMRYEPVAIQKKAVDELVAYYETGDMARFQEHCVAWVKTKAAVDYLNGFHEVYKDPRAVVGAFEANVSVRQESEPLDRLSQNALYFEGKMPWKDAWKRAKVDPPVAITVQALVETGDAGPISPAAYNLPNASEFRKQYGSKNVVLQNIMLAESPEIRNKTLEAFFEQFGSKVNPDWQKDAQARLAAIARPRETAFVFPQLVPVLEEKNGREILKDVRLESKETLAEQMLRYRAWGRSRELAPK